MVRVVSLLPSATEILLYLGVEELLVGRSHECDVSAFVSSLPVCTAPKFDAVTGSSQETHKSASSMAGVLWDAAFNVVPRVATILQHGLAPYAVKLNVLQMLRPDVIITHTQSDQSRGAISDADIESALTELLGRTPRVVSLNPLTLDVVWRDVIRVANAVLRPETAAPALDLMQRHVGAIRAAVAAARSPGAPRVRVCCIQWTDPLMVASAIPYVNDLLSLVHAVAVPSSPDGFVGVEDIVKSGAEVIVIMLCGIGLERCEHEWRRQVASDPRWSAVRARVCVVDAFHLFSRPCAPALVTSLEALAQMVHPNLRRTLDFRTWRTCDCTPLPRAAPEPAQALVS